MLKWAAIALLMITGPAAAQRGGFSAYQTTPPESVRSDITDNNLGYSSTFGKSIRNLTINPAAKTLVLLIDGQSNMTSVAPSAYSPTNGSAMDNFNIYDGAIYAVADPVLGPSYNAALGPGSIAGRLADVFINNAIFDQVIVVPIAIGGTSIAIHSAGGALYERPCVAMRKLASRGIVPGMTGVTFAYLWGQGESDHGTAQASYEAGFQQIVARLKGCPGVATQFSGRVFINIETILANTTDATIQAAQAAVVDNVSIFQGGNLDTLTGATNRQADGTHFTNTGLANAATLIYNAMRASGAPF